MCSIATNQNPETAPADAFNMSDESSPEQAAANEARAKQEKFQQAIIAVDVAVLESLDPDIAALFSPFAPGNWNVQIALQMQMVRSLRALAMTGLGKITQSPIKGKPIVIHN